MPDGEPGEARSFDEQLVVMEDARLMVKLVGQQLAVAGRPVELVRRLVVGDGRRAGEVVAAARLVPHDEGIRAVERRGDDDPAAGGGGAAAPGGGVEQAVVGEVDDERRHVDAADDQTSSGRLVDAAVELKL